ncbi:MAG: beta-lactamase family protein [Burkholderiales bacterium]|nr:beta-lactamase family protein [Burkholderiales bacterium]
MSKGSAFFRRLLALAGAAALLFAAGAPAGALAQGTTFPGETWAEAPPAASGWSAEKLQAADETARAIGTGAYLVVHRGVLVHAFGPVAQPMNLASVRKSMLSVLYGIEVDRKKIDIDKTLAELGIDDKGGLSDTEKQATVRQLLQSRSGIYHPAAYEMAAMKAERPYRGSHEPGTFWYYNNWDFNALGTVFEKITGSSVFAALDRELARPLAFQDFILSRDTRSVTEWASSHAAYVMRISARDLARVGLLMAREGRWQGRQIVSKEWIAESTRSYTAVAPGLGYGYLWWVGRDGWAFRQRFPGAVFSGRGNYGQFLLVDPVRDLVVVHRVEMDRLFAREVSEARFGDLLEKILAAAPGGF